LRNLLQAIIQRFGWIIANTDGAIIERSKSCPDNLKE
jgi:hypothetical protein